MDRRLLVATVAVGAVVAMSGPVAATTHIRAHPTGSAPARGASSGHRASGSASAPTASGSYSVTYSASGEVPNQDPATGSSLVTESYRYTVAVQDLPLYPPYLGGYANFENTDSHASRYLSVSDAEFAVDGPCGDRITQTGPGRTDNTATLGLGIGATPPYNAGFDLAGINVEVPVDMTSVQDGDCTSSPSSATLSPVGDNDDVTATEDRGHAMDDVSLGFWTADEDAQSAVQQDFSRGPKSTCKDEIPKVLKRAAGSCTATNKGSGSATETATIRWDITTAHIPVFRLRVVAGNHQSVRPGRRFKLLEVRDVEPGGKPVPPQSGVTFRVKHGSARVLAPSYTGTFDRGLAEAEIKAGKHKGPVVIVARADGGKKAVHFHLHVRH